MSALLHTPMDSGVSKVMSTMATDSSTSATVMGRFVTSAATATAASTSASSTATLAV